jgi:hypothetical protein
MRKDVSSVSPEQSPKSKRQHVIEVCNFVDAGTSIALFAQAREDFHEQTAMEAVIIFLQTYGRPRQMTFDRDPRSRWGQRRARFSFSPAPSLALSGDRT